MTWPDYVTIALCIVMGIVESRRGFVPAFFAMIGAILTVEIAPAVYTKLVSPSLTYTSAYVIAILIGFAVTAAATLLLKRYAPTDIGSFDSALGGVAGVLTGLVMAHAMYGAVILGYGGKLAPVYANSAFGAQVYDLDGVHGFLRFMGKIGSSDITEPAPTS
jgi:uncharacterized membrane protein required for colicin V production